MDRRAVLKSAGVLAAASFGMQAMAAEHEHHMGGNPHQKLIDTTSDCIQKGHLCIAHCLMMLGEGNKSMAACAQSVNQMISMCTALMELATQESSHLKALAKITAEVCKECEAECKKHADKHEVCKNCLESCKACRKACEALAA